MLIIGRAMMHREDGDGSDVVPLKQLPDRRVIVSVPCSIHSRKPPLGSEGFLISLARDHSVVYMLNICHTVLTLLTTVSYTCVNSETYLLLTFTKCSKSFDMTTCLMHNDVFAAV